jgi:hypothetical protein
LSVLLQIKLFCFVFLPKPYYMRHFLYLLALLFSTNLFGQVYINEFSASNATLIADPDYAQFSDWIELYNASSNNIDLSGYRLSDNYSDSLKWTIPNGTNIAPNGYLIIWADGTGVAGSSSTIALHTSYSLSRTGEEIALWNNNGELLDLLIYGEQTTNYTYGRSTDAATTWSYFEQATPNGTNNIATPFVGFVPYEPIVETAGGFYNTDTLTVSITNVAQVGQIRYTLDGSDPTLSSNLYVQPITISSTAVLRARLFMPNYIAGKIITNSYFLNEGFETRQLPVLSLSTNPAYFWDTDIGLYVQDFKPEWEYPVHLEFYEPDGLLGFHHDAGIKVDGENSWQLPQKMLSVYSRKQYSTEDYINYQLFPDNPRRQFENIILRCSGNDWSNTLFRDGMQQSLTQNNMDLDIQDFRACMVYINGQYLGIHNIRTRGDEEYLQQKFGVNTDSLDIIENENTVESGNNIAYNQMIALLNNGVTDNAQFEQLAQIMDTRNYTDYILNQMFCANTSWGHNIACWRAQNDTARFRWLLLDFDRGFYNDNANGVAMDFFTTTNGQDWSNPAWATLFLRKMLENEAYQQYFIQKAADHLYTTYHPRTINKKIDGFAQNIAPEMPNHIARWLGTTSSYGNAMPSYNYWLNEVQQLRNYATNRNNFLFQDLNSFFALNSTNTLSLDVSHPTHGYIYLRQNKVPEYPWSGAYFNNIPIALIAQPKIGYQFSQWEQTQLQTQNMIAPQAQWTYSDATTAPPTNWAQPDFDDSTWQQGNAQLGYGDGDEATTLSYGSNSNNKTPSYYFRKAFDLANIDQITALNLQIIADDGAVIYLNGTELARYNMPTGDIAFDTYAQTAITNAAEDTWQSISLPLTNLVNGTNVLAISLHQADGASSDISFDAQLSITTQGASTILGNADTLVVQLDNAPLSIRAIFEPIGLCLLPDTIFNNTDLNLNCSPYYAQGDVTIKPNATLNVAAGVQIYMPQNAALWVNGALKVQGTDALPCHISLNTDPNKGGTTDPAATWRGILCKNTTDTVALQYFDIDRASAGLHRVYYPAALSAYRAPLKLDNITLNNVADNPIFARYSAVSLRNSHISSRVTGDCINVKQGYAQVENCTFSGAYEPDMDAIDYDGVINGIVRNCLIHDFRGDNNDGMDIGEQCQNLLIEGNFIYHCADKAISCGQRSSALLYNNTLAYCNMGIALKDLSPISIDHNTLHACNEGISAYEKNAGYKGGIGTVTNTIVSNCLTAAYIADSTSILNVSHSLSDTDTLAGAGNITANALMIDPTRYNFNLRNASPALFSGTGGSNMGAINLPTYGGLSQVLLSEIYFNDTADGEAEFIELYNPNNQSIDLSGYSLSEAITFTFPEGSQLLPQSYGIVANNALSYDTLSNGAPIWQWTNGRLANEGETIVLRDKNGIVADFVAYQSQYPWADTLVTLGKSLQLIADSLDNHFYTSWQISQTNGGTPTTDNTISVGLAANMAYNKGIALIAYPNPSAEPVHIAIKNEAATLQNVYLTLTDTQGNTVWQQKNLYLGYGLHQLPLPTQNWANGYYIVTLHHAQGKVLARGSLAIIRP